MKWSSLRQQVARRAPLRSLLRPARRQVFFEPLEGRTLLASLPAGFSETIVAAGLSSATAMEFAPNGDLWVLEQTGAVKRFRPQSTTADVVANVSNLGLNSAGERGLLGITFDPQYLSNKRVYLYYTATTPNLHNRVSQFTVVDTDAADYYFSGTNSADADAGTTGTPTSSMNFDLDPLNASASNHNGGAIHFGPDGKLYVAVGENAAPANAQSLNSLLGKMLRINSDGTIPTDNPFYDGAGPNRDAIWALGLRNPYTFTFQPGTNRMFINDVGEQTYEEINDGIAGSNYGWPGIEGNVGTAPSSPGTYRGPLYVYTHGSGSLQGRAITGGAFYNPTIQQFPASFVGDYFFADYVNDWINVFDVGAGTATPFATSAPGAVDLRVTSDGGLYYLARDAGSVSRIIATSPWSGYAHDPQHTAVSAYMSQPMTGVAWQAPVDLAPQYSGGGNLLIHYGSPLVTAANTVIVPVKTGASGGFRVEGRSGTTGALKWTQDTDYIWPPHNWGPSYAPTLTPANRLYFAGAGGTLYYMNSPDANGATVSGQLAFFGLANYNANRAAYDGSVFINTPLTSDGAGNIYFGFQVTGSNPLGLVSGIARIDANGNATYVSAATAANDGSVSKVVMNAAPALSKDGQTLYVPVSRGSGGGYLLALNSTTLAQTGRVALKDPGGNDASLPDDGSASPTIGPNGDVYFGVLENPSGSNGYRGWLLHFSSNLAQSFTPGAFGWDTTPAIVPRTMIPSYTGTSPYLLMTKYNNYLAADFKLAVLDPYDTATDPVSGRTTMKPVLTINGPDEWCINTGVVDPQTNSVIANSEDGKVYRWNLVTNTLTESVTLTEGIGEAYTPTLIGVDGTVYAINNATLFAVRAAPEITVTLAGANVAEGQTIDFGTTPPGTPVTRTFTVTNDGTAALTLTSLAAATFPAGFSLAADYGSLSLAAGQSTTFGVRLNAAAAGAFTGTLQLANNDANENPFDLLLSGTVSSSNSTVVVALDAGGGAAGAYSADQFFTGGTAYATSAAINTSGVTNPAPQTVYQTERYGNFTYALPGLTPSAQYIVRLHFAEIYWQSANQRLFNVQINGGPALTNYDVFADAGGASKAVVKSFTATADSAGKITIAFTTVKDNAKLSGIEILTTGAASTPPTVVTAASVNPSPVTGTAANLSVLGNDSDTGEPSLTYTWSVVAAPAGASPPTFSANASNAAKNSAVNFFQAGSYTLRATITDPSLASVTSDVNVTVNQTATTVVVAPAAPTVVNSGTQQFTATMLDQFGTALAAQPAFAWTVDSGGLGSINASGQYTAPGSGTGSATIRATGAGRSGTATVSVVAQSSVVLAIDAGGGPAGGYTADQFFAGGTSFGTGAVINTSGVTNPAPQTVYQTERYGNFSYTVPGLTPGSQYTVRLHFAEIYWTSANQRLFNVQINGNPALTNYDVFADAGAANKAVVKSFNATADATGKITITFATIKDNAKVSGIEVLATGTSNAPPTVASTAAASPNPVTGNTASLSVVGADADTGEPSLTYTWSVIAAPAGAATPTFNASGTNAAKNSMVSFFQAGSYTLRATITDPSFAAVTSDANVTVNQVATTVVVAPAAPAVVNNGTQQFTATMLDQFGTALASQPGFTWSVDSGGLGSINASGLYTAPASGTGPAIVRATSGAVSGTAQVNVVPQSSVVLAVDSGGGAAGAYTADQYFSGGTTFSTGAAINTSGVSNPAPQAVYQTERYGNFTYALPGLTPGSQYTVRLHFAEIYWSTAGQRLFNVQINGNVALSNYDIFADAGGANKAIVKSFTATADATGKITITFSTIRDNAKLSGLEILAT